MSGGNVHKIGSLDFYEATIMAETAKREGVCIAIDRTGALINTGSCIQKKTRGKWTVSR